MRRIMTLIVLFGLSVGPNISVAVAHHSTGAYDRMKPMSLEGKITEVEWVNPHAWIHMDVKDASGKVTNWAVECGAPNALVRRGLKKDSIPVGTVIVVKGYPARDGSHIIILNSGTREDGSPLLEDGGRL